MWMFLVLAYPIGIIRTILIIQGLVLAKKSAFVKCINIQNKQKDAIRQPSNITILIIFANFLYVFLFNVIKLSFGYFCFNISYIANGIIPSIEPIIILIQESCLT